MKRIAMALAIPALFLGCSEDKKPHNGSVNSDSFAFWKQDAQTLTIQTADGQRIPGAQILIGDALNSPFEGNFLTTDSSGQVVVPAAWTSSETLTVQAAGYVRSTYLNQEPGAVTLTLRAQPTRQQYEVKGVTSGLPIADKDGFVDFGLVMPAFSKIDILRFDMNNIISPQNDRITALGQDIDIPANLALPRQSEKYGLFTVTLDKPAYRIYYGQPGVSRVFVARGRFPFKSTVDNLRGGKEFYEMLNDFRINGGAIRDISVESGSTRLDLPTRELNFTAKNEVVAPTLRGDEMFIAAAVANQSGYLIPTDFKQVEQNKKTSLNLLPNSEAMVLGVVMRRADMKNSVGRMSATLLPFTGSTAPQMLPLIPDPTLTNQGEILMPKFNTIAGVNPIATYTVLSKEEEVVQGSAKVKILNPQWEVYASSWVESVKLPQWPNDAQIPGKKRWEVNFIGSQTTSQTRLGPAMIEAATHVTHSSISF